MLSGLIFFYCLQFSFWTQNRGIQPPLRQSVSYYYHPVLSLTQWTMRVANTSSANPTKDPAIDPACLRQAVTVYTTVLLHFVLPLPVERGTKGKGGPVSIPLGGCVSLLSDCFPSNAPAGLRCHRHKHLWLNYAKLPTTPLLTFSTLNGKLRGVYGTFHTHTVYVYGCTRAYCVRTVHPKLMLIQRCGILTELDQWPMPSEGSN